MSSPTWPVIVSAVAAIGYAIAAAIVVHMERTSFQGGFITLKGMAPALATLPISIPFEQLGHKLDYRSNLHMGGAILACAGLVFGCMLGLVKLGQLVVHLLTSR